MRKHEVMFGIGFFIMLIGCMAADSNLIVTATLVLIGAALVMGGKHLEKRHHKGANHNSNSYMVKHQLHSYSKRS